MNTPAPVASLRRRLLLWILPSLLILIGINAVVGYGNAVHSANEAHDRSLYLAARTLAEELHWDQGRLQVEGLRGAGYLFANHTGSRLFYKVQDLQGQSLAGDPRLPDVMADPSVPVRYFALVQFGDGQMVEGPVRLARLTHVLDATGQGPLLHITVAETLEARQALIARILRDTLISQGLLVLAVAGLVVWGVQRGIRPLEAFRQRLAERADDDLSPISLEALPRELKPLFATLNGYLARLGRLIDVRKRFLDNAAHQLRTPLTVLRTQLTLAERQAQSGVASDPQLALWRAARQTTEDAVRLTEQLLAMTRVEHAREWHSHGPVDLCELARLVLQEQVWRAHQSGYDLGLVTEVERCEVQGVSEWLHEALQNLLENAMHHNPPGTHITVRVQARGVSVVDDGVGIAPEHLPHVFERFYRAARPGQSGSGLGLAIVQEIATQHGAQVQAQSPVEGGRGTCIRLEWPLAARP